MDYRRNQSLPRANSNGLYSGVMNLPTAVQSGFRNYKKFSGRASRSEYWWWALFSILVQLVPGFVLGSVGDAAGSVLSLALLVPTIAVAIRRMHDTNHRGWWMLFPIVNFVFAVTKGNEGENRFGPPPPPRAV